MNALSRREEETLLKTAKTRALKECDPLVRGMVDPTLEISSYFISRVCGMCGRADRDRRMGMQGQAQGHARLHGAIVSLCTRPASRLIWHVCFTVQGQKQWTRCESSISDYENPRTPLLLHEYLTRHRITYITSTG
jgi:hypothetical protein